MNVRSKSSCGPSLALGGPKCTGPELARPPSTLAALRTWSFGHRSFRCVSNRSARTSLPQCGQGESVGRPFRAGLCGWVTTRGGPGAMPTLVFNLIRALGRAVIAFSSLTNSALLKPGLASNRPTTPVPPQRKHVGLAPRQVQSGTSIRYIVSVEITTVSSGAYVPRRASSRPPQSGPTPIPCSRSLRRRPRTLGARCALARRDGSSYQGAAPAPRARLFLVLCICSALGGFWGYPGVHTWVNSGKDG